MYDFSSLYNYFVGKSNLYYLLITINEDEIPEMRTRKKSIWSLKQII